MSTTYLSNNPCRKGHGTLRYLTDNRCVECRRLSKAAEYLRNRNSIRKKHARYYAANVNSRRAINQKWKIANKSRHVAGSIKWAKEHPDQVKQRRRAWKKKHKGAVNQNTRRRRARKLNQLCSCCTPRQITAIYDACPPGREVDHRIPLALGGLHCRHNLQILTVAEHRTKTTNDMRLIRAAA